MKTWRFLTLAAVTSGLTLTVGLSAHAAPPATEPPPASEPAPTDGSVPTGADGGVSEDDPTATGEELGIVHSWALAPAGTDDSGGNRPNLAYSASAGSVIEDAVTLYNFGNQELPFRVYATDAYNDDTGAFTLLVGDEVPSDSGSWIKLDAEHITIPANAQATIPFTLTIPPNAAPGDHAGAILASSPTIGRGDEQQVITLDRRTGTRVYIRVDGPLEPELSIENLSTDFSGSANPLGGSATVKYRVENRGNVRLSGNAVASVAGPFGVSRKTADALAFEELLPGEGFDVSVDVDDVPALGVLDTDVTISDLVEGDGEAVDQVTRSALGVALPVTILLVLLVLIFAMLALRAARRHRGRPEVLPPGSGHTSERELQST